MKIKLLALSVLTGALIFNACRKDVSTPHLEVSKSAKKYSYLKPTKEQEIVLSRFKLATYVVSEIISEKSTREKLNQFILSKVKKTGNDEELTFKEIFSGKKVNLDNVSSDFLSDFRNKFIKVLLDKKFRHNDEFKGITFRDENEILKYFGISSNKVHELNSSTNSPLVVNPYLEELTVDPGFEIYFPYSENYENYNYQQNPTYSVTYNPLTNKEENEGEIFDYVTGTYKYVTLVNDDFAYTTPTYIITIDDGLTYDDMAYNAAAFVGSAKYKIQLSDDDYNPVVFENSQTPLPQPFEGSSTCVNRELRVKDGRWTLIHNGYGLFEGKIEFAVALASGVSSVITPIGTDTSNPLLNLNTESWTYKALKRKTVKKMRDNKDEYVNFAFNISPWCPGDPDKMIFIYEYDRGAKGASEFSTVIANGLGLIGSPAVKAAVAALNLAPAIKVVFDGKSRIEYYGLIGSNEVYQNQRLGTAAFDYPNGLFREFRPYGNSSVLVTLVVD